ncbi:expressed unknown protein [Seminavis robusta]|uniref:BHLH domain-containing protein n=1 Tax=Seminavis robusta TaxID=568900 RepID=A0A9N8HEE2_9STRA|nr:expressed unknown protein [Seminavis robusta]|eukprot:Sro383_g131290.1 n/a (210) ;mRNA; r:27300-28036
MKDDDCKEKSERKRQREKQRRSELTNAFDDLSAMVLKMDNPDDEAGESSGRKKGRRLSSRSEGENDTGGMTRVDLINRALTIMKRLHQENRELKESLTRSGGRDKGSAEIMVMVPTLTPADDGSPPPPGGPAVGSFRPPYMPGFAPLTQQEHGQPPPYAGPPSRYPPPPPQQGAWGPFPPGAPPAHYAGSDRGHRLPPPPPPHDAMQRR